MGGRRMDNNLSGAPPEIVVVDDSAVEAELLRRCLDRAGYRIVVTKNGMEGLQAARARRPALVVSDIQMPLMNGYELCHAIKYDEELWNVPVILLTILSEPEDIMKAINSGADSYIIKPFVEAGLLERIRSLLATPIRRRRTDERRSEKVEYDAKPYTITGSSQQTLNLLLSVYGNTLAQNHDLTRIQAQLNLLNESLDDQVRGRTAELLQEKRKLERANRALRTLSACNVALVHAGTEEELFQSVCRHIVETGGHLFAEVSFPAEGPGGVSAPVSRFGSDDVSRRLAQRALPLMNEGRLYGTLTVFSSVSEAFDAAEVKLLEELAGDIAYGIATLRARAERDRAIAGELRSAAELRRVLEQTITAIALTLEKRDPYTAGHQRRVAELAASIAEDMGLAQGAREGIHFGGLIHDIGKVSVPTEILCKPGGISGIEFDLIRTHPEAGYEILREIAFPWPVADMVRQHHERLDGSGYPQGLKGDRIILEARILAVADVVEAIVANRPYRAGLGMDAALAEIMRGRGARLDAAAVDSCLRVIREKGFVFTKT